jgi:signal peptide peptidase SppA
MTPKTKRKNMAQVGARAEHCAAQHFGPWMVEPSWFTQAVNAVKAGTFAPQSSHGGQLKSELPANAECEIVDGRAVVLYYIDGNMARIPMFGQMTKGDSSFGGVNSVRARRALRKAAEDDRVGSILLHIDSPGGTVSGTGDLAADVATINREKKPVYTYIEDLGASAAYWVASQASRIYANPTAHIGSIGTVAVVEDTSGAMDKAGVKVHVVSTGDYKGNFTDGAPITDNHLAELRRMVNECNDHFLAGVSTGRKRPMETVKGWADGRVWIAEEAKRMGLIDDVATIDTVFQEIQHMTDEQIAAHLAEHPELSAKYIEQGKKAGIAEGTAQSKDRLAALLKAADGNHKLAYEAFQQGHEPEAVALAVAQAKEAREQAKAESDAKQAQIDAQAKEIERLKTLAGTQGAVNTTAAVQETEEKKQEVNPVEAFNTIVAKKVSDGMSRKAAIRSAVSENPELHQAYIAAINAGRKA